MAALALKTAGTSSQGGETSTGWDSTTILLEGPEAYSAASPEVRPSRSNESHLDEAPADDVFDVGSDDESTDGDDDNDDNPSQPQTPVAALRVRRGAIKTITLPPKGVQIQGSGLDTTISQGRQAQGNIKAESGAPSWFELDEVEALKDRDVKSCSQQAEDPQAQIDRYWQPTGHYRASAKADPGHPPAEVDSTAEADRGAASSAKGAGSSMRVSIASSPGLQFPL
ncbi:hypothetical protein N657DRAFT_633688 [Parathielavia appendiculata]|uniref:Uncharacterized protein n=1 Tax=Parathielavia appendiculata TaxID=2587402 RepID=A0AAN6U1P6_9PEZI|nr:hypothetical protein N657DRAFT_633688 [Parathielavia appendiculata]